MEQLETDFPARTLDAQRSACECAPPFAVAETLSAIAADVSKDLVMLTGFRMAAGADTTCEKEIVRLPIDICADDLRTAAEALDPHTNGAPLSELIAQRGYETFASIGAMTEYDTWMMWREEMMRKMEEFYGKVRSDPDNLRLIVADRQEERRSVRRNGTQSQERTEIDRMLDELMPDFERVAEEILTRELAPPEKMLLGDNKIIWEKSIQYLESHAPQERTSLTEKIGCNQFKNEMDYLERSHQWNALAAKQRELAGRIFSEVTRFPYKYEADQQHEKTSYQSGNPVFVSENRRLTCFTGPWLIASLLLKGGIKYRDLFYCNVNEVRSESGGILSASHGSLLMKLCDGTMQTFDYSRGNCGQPLALSLLDQNDREAFVAMTKHCDAEGNAGRRGRATPVRVRVKGDTAEKLGIDTDMHVMPVDQGFAAVTLLHAGIAFEEEGKPEEALVAYTLGLASHPGNPDLRCRLAILSLQQGDTDRAGEHLRIALQEYEHHLQARFYSGIHALQKEDAEGALSHFHALLDPKRKPWGDQSFVTLAKQYCDALDQADLQIQKLKVALDPLAIPCIDINQQ